MTFLLTILGCVALVFFGWIALYLLVFTASIAWHAGAKAERRNSITKELRRLLKTVMQVQGELKEIIDDGIERQDTVH